VLVFDFDGVICDSWRECALVTWGAHHNWPPVEFSVAAFDAVPAGFTARFRALRGFARHLGHFLVPLLAVSQQVESQADFDRCYGALAPDTVKEFVTRASRYREAVRNEQRECWLAFHHMYEGMLDLLSELAGNLYVVTARDSTSVRDLLGSHGIDFPPERIYGEQQSKLAALADIQAREGVETDRVRFVDDSLSNIVAAREVGHSVAWATWGYSAPEHTEKAARLGVPRLALSELPATALAAGAWLNYQSAPRQLGEERKDARSNTDGRWFRRQ
jgi:phosphoglycolate phosphatase-like HAD superfamily hydrolase